MSAEVHGLLLVDKPGGMTSHDVVARARRILQQKSIGHTGTLDPLATGLMMLVLGEATKISDYLVLADKAYSVGVGFGRTTDTLDIEGQTLTQTEARPSAESARDVAFALHGEFEWPVPHFSAAKVAGKKLYEYAREGVEIVQPMKMMKFWDVKILSQTADLLEAHIECSKGSFIRSWAHELGQRLGVGGVVQSLRRTRVGGWSVDAALTLEQLENKLGEGQGLGSSLVPLEKALPSWRPMMASEKDARLIQNGQVPRDMANRLIFEMKQAFASGEPEMVKVLGQNGGLMAILAAEPGKGLKIRRVFRTIT